MMARVDSILDLAALCYLAERQSLLALYVMGRWRPRIMGGKMLDN